MSSRIDAEVKAGNEFANKIEELVLARQQAPTGERNTLLMAYWSLVFEFQRAILSLIDHKFYGAAFALVRPIVEAVVRAHIATLGSNEDVEKLHADTYRTNLSTVGQQIDTAFGTGDFFQKFLTGARVALHGYTHAGMHQLGRRFKGTDLIPNYDEGEIIEVIRVSTSSAFMVNNLVTKHFGFEDEWKQNTDMFDQWGKHPHDKQIPAWMQLPSIYSGGQKGG